ncbi:type II secretion system protein [bacterium]|nr:type II secretion system protein [bacterium]
MIFFWGKYSSLSPCGTLAEPNFLKILNQVQNDKNFERDYVQGATASHTGLGREGKCSYSLALMEGVQTVNLSAPIGEVARSAAGEISRRDKKFEFCHPLTHSLTRFRFAQPPSPTKLMLWARESYKLNFRSLSHRARAGFTLAEVLITIGIIGVVAALTIPSLMTKITEHQTISKLRETQSILQQAMRMAEEEYGDAESWGLDEFREKSVLKVAEYLKPYLKIVLDCRTYDIDLKCLPSASYPRKNNSIIYNFATSRVYYKVILLNSTAVWWGISYPNNSIVIDFYVDVNGKSKPNTVGIDLFAFKYTDKTLKPYGAYDNYNYKSSCLSENGDGWGCAYYVLNFGNMNYPK